MAPDAEQPFLEQPVGGQLGGWHGAPDAAVDHDRDPFGNRGRDRNILFDEQDGDAVFPGQRGQQFLDLVDDQRREAFGRFVEDQEFGVLQKRPGDREHLLFAARKLAAAVVAALRQSGEGVVNPVDVPGAATLPGQPQMLVDGERRPEPAALGRIADAEIGDPVRRQPDQFLTGHADRSALHRQQAHDGVAQRRLAHAVAADHRVNAGHQLQIDALERVGRAVVDVQIPDAERMGVRLQSAGAATHARPRCRRARDTVPGPRDRSRSLRASPV